jgi:DNA-binding transcriptional ArsR family regulator
MPAPAHSRPPEHPDLVVAAIAAAIGEPARTRMLYALMDGHARTSTELATVAEVSPSTASVHLARLLDVDLLDVAAQGRHRYYRLKNRRVADMLEGMNVLAGGSRRFQPSTPVALRSARRCYDHAAGTLGVQLHDAMLIRGWLSRSADAYTVTTSGQRRLAALNVDLEAARASRRKFAFPCLDWSERRAHLGGALAAALLASLLRKRWLRQELDSRALHITHEGRTNLRTLLGVSLETSA